MRRYTYGPVLSRRLGRSLGIDLVPYKTCTFDCVYCQLGRTTNKTVERREYLPVRSILREIEEFSWERIDYITLAGSGEPTLNSKIGEVIEGIKSISSTPVAILTNGSLLGMRSLQDEISSADLVIPSIDAASQRIFEMINRPHRSLRIRSIIEGLRAFRERFSGEIWLEVMLVKGLNDAPDEIELLKSMIEDIGLDKIQLNTVVRPPCEDWVLPLDEREMRAVCNLFRGRAEIIGVSQAADVGHERVAEVRSQILELLGRRPCTIEDVSGTIGLHRNEALKQITILEKEGLISSRVFEGVRYFRAR
ncbi:MAG: radical SAM protein [Candidatus Syntrophoarchaeum butanivorans]|nr:MAG: radical SAM protein [Candidatus Syntrophoarchaeum butanivorans]